MLPPQAPEPLWLAHQLVGASLEEPHRPIFSYATLRSNSSPQVCLNPNLCSHVGPGPSGSCDTRVSGS